METENLVLSSSVTTTGGQQGDEQEEQVWGSSCWRDEHGTSLEPELIIFLGRAGVSGQSGDVS